MKNQTLSIEHMKRLKDLGVDVSKASMCWWLPMERLRSEEGYFLDAYEPHVHEQMSDDPIIMAFTLQDMLEMIPVYVLVDNVEYWMELYLDTNCITETERNYHMRYKDINSKSVAKVVGATSVLESAYLMLCWLAENGHLKGGKP